MRENKETAHEGKRGKLGTRGTSATGLSWCAGSIFTLLGSGQPLDLSSPYGNIQLGIRLTPGTSALARPALRGLGKLLAPFTGAFPILRFGSDASN